VTLLVLEGKNGSKADEVRVEVEGDEAVLSGGQ
jgi:hypothetical protein